MKTQYESPTGHGVCLGRANTLKRRLEQLARAIGYYPRLERAFLSLNGNFTTKISIQSMARRAALSRAAFARLFKAATGVGFHQFLILEAIRRALELMERGDESLTDIALKAGFENLWSLEYNFKRIIGCPPTHYKKIILQYRKEFDLYPC